MSHSVYLGTAGLKELNSVLSKKQIPPTLSSADDDDLPSRKSTRRRFRRDDAAVSRVKSVGVANARKALVDAQGSPQDEVSQLTGLLAHIAEMNPTSLLAVTEAVNQNPNLVKIATPEGNTLLHAVFSLNDLTWGWDLLQKGASPAARSKTGHTPLHYMAEQPISQENIPFASSIIEYSLKNGSKVTDTASDGSTVLHTALAHANLSGGLLIPVLLELGYDPNSSSNDGVSCLHIALENQFIELAEWMVERGCSVSSKTSSGVSILDVAYQALGDSHPLYATIWHKIEEKRVKDTTNIINEIVQTETDYCRDLEIVQEHYRRPLLAEMHLSEQADRAIFWNIEQILPANQQALTRLQAVLAQPPNEQQLAKALLPIIPHLRDVYIPYVSNQSNSIETLKLIQNTCHGVAAWMLAQRNIPAVRNQPLDSYLIKPLQRITRYPLLIRELQKHIPEYHPDYSDLQTLSAELAQVLTESNEAKRVCDDRFFFKLAFRNLDAKLHYDSVILHQGVASAFRGSGRPKLIEISYFVFSDAVIFSEVINPVASNLAIWESLYYEHIAVWDVEQPNQRDVRLLIVRRDKRDRNVTLILGSPAEKQHLEQLLKEQITVRMVPTPTPVAQILPGDLLPPLESEIFQPGYFDPADSEMVWYDNAVQSARLSEIPKLLEPPADGSWTIDPLTQHIHSFMLQLHRFQRDIYVVLQQGIAQGLKTKAIPASEEKFLCGDLLLFAGAHAHLIDASRNHWKNTYAAVTSAATPPLANPYGASQAVLSLLLTSLETFLQAPVLVQYCSDLPIAVSRINHLQRSHQPFQLYLSSFQALLERTPLRVEQTDLTMIALLSRPLQGLQVINAWLTASLELTSDQLPVKRLQAKMTDLLADIQKRSPYSERFASLIAIQDSIKTSETIPIATRGRLLLRSGTISVPDFAGSQSYAKSAMKMHLFDDIFVLSCQSLKDSRMKLVHWGNISDVKFVDLSLNGQESWFILEHIKERNPPKSIKITIAAPDVNAKTDWARDLKKRIKEYQMRLFKKMTQTPEPEVPAKDNLRAQALISIGGGKKGTLRGLTNLKELKNAAGDFDLPQRSETSATFSSSPSSSAASLLSLSGSPTPPLSASSSPLSSSSSPSSSSSSTTSSSSSPSYSSSAPLSSRPAPPMPRRLPPPPSSSSSSSTAPAPSRPLSGPGSARNLNMARPLPPTALRGAPPSSASRPPAVPPLPTDTSQGPPPKPARQGLSDSREKLSPRLRIHPASVSSPPIQPVSIAPQQSAIQRHATSPMSRPMLPPRSTPAADSPPASPVPSLKPKPQLAPPIRPQSLGAAPPDALKPKPTLSPASRLSGRALSPSPSSPNPSGPPVRPPRSRSPGPNIP